MRPSTSLRTSLGALAAAALVVLVGVSAMLAGTGASSAARTARPHAHALSAAPATGALGLDLLGRMGAGNVVLSPDSVAAALAMAGSGAAGRTAAQIVHALHLSSPATLADVGRLQEKIVAEQAAAGAGDPQAATLLEANGLFVQAGFAAASPFVAELDSHLGAAPQSLDFEHDPAGAARAINAWVSAHTQGIIPRILGSLKEATRLVLANELYLKAAWGQPFHTDATAPGPFHGPGPVSSTPFMHETSTLPYARGRGYAAVELPYRGSTLSLLVLLPDGPSVAPLQRRLDPALLTHIVRSLAPRDVRLSLPRFHLTLTTSLVPVLQQLGVSDAFSEVLANFSRISSTVPLKIGQVAHAADLRIDEQGTVAAATTVITVEATSAPIATRAVSF